jgi:hypothetical protein
VSIGLPRCQVSKSQIFDKQNPFAMAEIEQQSRDLFMAINRIGRQTFGALGIKEQIDCVLDRLCGPWRRCLAQFCVFILLFENTRLSLSGFPYLLMSNVFACR